MNKIDSLKCAHFTVQRVREKTEQIARLEALAEKCTTTLSGMPKGTTSDSRIEEIVLKIVELKEELMNDISEELERYEQNRRTIAEIGSNLGKVIFEMRYLNFKTWQEIADAVGYERSYVAKIHDKIIKELKEGDTEC